ncbi:MAG: phenylalanine--tRNA ligase subunit beta [Nitrospinae bacterium]|nr:phenylalanine--tRNA ligase subunit beta [Nitrospinota bacterium]
MRLSLLWLNEWIDHGLAPDKLAEKLTSLGLETKITEDRRGAFNNVVVGKVLSVGPHPNADAIRLTTVNAGAEPLTIVCGAPNVAAGQTVAVALVGASLPNGMKMEKRKIRGVESSGMICSEAELGISAESSGIMVLDDAFDAGAALSSLLELEDVMFEVDLTPNRGDCLGVVGVAREVAAITGAKPKVPPLLFRVPSPAPASGISGLGVEVKDAEACPRYTALEISGVRVAPSPFKIRRRLLACGIRPINNVVDATNYAMLETGNPLHAFDRRFIKGSIVVRGARAGEEFTTLDGKTFRLEAGMPLIADSEKGLALAGVMGGLNSGVLPDTTDIILEAAYFDPVITRRTSKKLGLGTESSYRFERGVDPEGVKLASMIAARMMTENAGGKQGGFVDAYPKKIQPPPIKLRSGKAGKILGVELNPGRELDYLTLLGFKCDYGADGVITATAPSHRHDIKGEIDLIEEIARLHGFENIPETLPRLPQHDSSREGRYAKRREVNRLLVASGFFEAVNYSFINPDWRRNLGLVAGEPVQMENRINAELSELRTSLVPGLLKTLSFNLRQGEEKLSLFETGSVFRMAGGDSAEEFMTAGMMTCGDEEIFSSKLGRDFHRLKGVVANVVRAAARVEPEFPFLPGDAKKKFLYGHRQVGISVRGTQIGYMGQVHPLSADYFDVHLGVVCFELSLDALLASVGKAPKARPIPRFPGIKRDVALVVSEHSEAGGIIETMLGADARIRQCRLFDLYNGPQVGAGLKSLAFRLFFMDAERTMTDKDGDDIIASILKLAKEKHGAVLRG